MQLGGRSFIFVCDLAPDRDSSGRIIDLAPQSRYKNLKQLPLNKYGNGPFCKFKIPNNIRACGVYAISIADEIQYVGECTNLSSRFNMGYGNISPKNCFKGGQETNCRINNLIYLAAKEGVSAKLWFHACENYKEMEQTLRAAKKYEWNRI